MAGPSPHPSLRRRLVLWLAVPMLVLLALDAALTYRVALHYANRAHDSSLADDAVTLAELLRREPQSHALSQQAQFLLRYDPNGPNYFAVISRRHGLLYGDSGLGNTRMPVPGARPVLYKGFHDQHHLRMATVGLASPYEAGDTLAVTVAETLRERHRSARDVLLMTLPLQAALIMVVLMLVWVGVDRGLGLLTPLTRRLAEREQALAPVTEADVPREILPLTRALDALFMRVRGAIALQERFITDAAHQLRTPLAGLQLHAERAMAAQDPAQLQQSLAHILAQTARAARASNQLLALSRAQAPHPGGETLEPLALDRLVPHAVAARVPEALDAGLDLGYQPPEAPVPAILGEARGVQELLDNLIDNALRYAGAGRSITVGVSAGQAWVILSVEDDGPGVPDALRARLGERFFRVPGAGGEGTGLGLAIVQGIASRHQAEVAFLRGAQGGLRVEVRFPVAPRPDTATDPVKHNPA